MDDETPRSPLPQWAWGAAVLGWLGGTVGAGIMAGLWAGASGGDLSSLGTQGFAQLGLWAGLAGSAVFTSRRGGSGSLAADLGFRSRPVDALVGAPVGVACQLVLVPAITWVLSLFTDVSNMDKSVRQIVEKAHGFSFLVLVLVVTVGAPIVEELFFRGLVLRSLQRHLPSAGAVVLSAVVFGVAHLAGAPALQLPALVSLGLVLAYMAVRTGRLGPCIWAHAAFNGVTMVALALQR